VVDKEILNVTAPVNQGYRIFGTNVYCCYLLSSKES
jgi:hypothetical protein